MCASRSEVEEVRRIRNIMAEWRVCEPYDVEEPAEECDARDDRAVSALRKRHHVPVPGGLRRAGDVHDALRRTLVLDDVPPNGM